jgi:hypothetical protein
MATGRRSVLTAGAALLVAGGGAVWRSGRHRAGAAPVADSVEDAAEERAAVQRLLDRRAAAVLARDRAARAATVTPAERSLRDAQAALLGNLARVPLAEWRYTLQALDAFPLPPVLPERDRLAARVQLAYRLSGFDSEPVTATQYLTFGRDSGGDWLLDSDSDHPGGDTQIWDLGPVAVVQGRSCLVLGLGGPTELKVLADQADRVVPVVSALWGPDWGQRTVWQAPLALDQFGRLLGVDPLAYGSIAAVTTGELGPAEAARTERITVNPQVWDSLNALGRQVVSTHETTHVATRAITEPWTPRWLSEGAANWTGYLGTGRTPQQIAPELLSDVAAGRVPTALPADAAFDGSASGLPQAYEQAWFACRGVVLRHGGPALVGLYRAVAATGGQGGQEKALDSALRRSLGTGLTAFTAQWRADLISAARTPRVKA